MARSQVRASSCDTNDKAISGRVNVLNLNRARARFLLGPRSCFSVSPSPQRTVVYRRDILRGRDWKVLLLGHSQGNFATNVSAPMLSPRSMNTPVLAT
eukprot:874855-Prorocentrum_minimum.AAC.5